MIYGLKIAVRHQNRNIIAEEKRTQLCIGIIKFVVNLNKSST